MRRHKTSCYNGDGNIYTASNVWGELPMLTVRMRSEQNLTFGSVNT